MKPLLHVISIIMEQIYISTTLLMLNWWLFYYYQSIYFWKWTRCDRNQMFNFIPRDRTITQLYLIILIQLKVNKLTWNYRKTSIFTIYNRALVSLQIILGLLRLCNHRSMYTWQLSLEILTLKTFDIYNSFVNSIGNNSILVRLNPMLFKYLVI